jgi:hypothetical protein
MQYAWYLGDATTTTVYTFLSAMLIIQNIIPLGCVSPRLHVDEGRTRT